MSNMSRVGEFLGLGSGNAVVTLSNFKGCTILDNKVLVELIRYTDVCV